MQRTRALHSARISRIFILLSLLLLRLTFGLSKELFADDESQIYLSGLRFHATHDWPLFGPDVVWTSSQIPGALQALLVGLPLDVLPIPEAPYLFLNVISMAALCLFAAYVCARVPTVPRWLIWSWLLTLPWTLEYSTHILNTSYVLPASLMFFIGFFEAWPPLSTGRVPRAAAHVLMGAAVGWMFQIHMSWPLLLPFVGLVMLARLREGVSSAAGAIGALLIGLILTGAFVIPTFFAEGATGGGGGTEQNLRLHWRNPATTLLNTTARFLSFASYEVGRFVSSAGGSAAVFLRERLWLLPFAAIVWIAGVIHPIVMLVTAFRRKTTLEGWDAIRGLAAATIVVVSAAFFFVMQPAQARSYYVVAPVAFLYAAHAWTFVDSPRSRRIAAAVLIANVVFQTAIAATRLHTASLYTNRAVVAEAIRQRQPAYFSYRRVFARDAPRNERVPAGGSPTARQDLEIIDPQMQLVRGETTWSLTLHNRSTSAAYRSIVCTMRYFGASGAVIEERNMEIWTVLQPGASIDTRVVDAVRWRPDIVRQEITVISADPVLPLAQTGRTGAAR